MSKLKMALALVLVVALTAGIAVAGTLAYMTSGDDDINVMTTGNVKIEQHEYERVLDEKGKPVLGVEGVDFKANYGITQSYKLQPFTQNKGVYPAFYNNDEDTVKYEEFQQLWNQVGAPGSNDIFDDSVSNVIDKFVFVENTGSVDCFFRTLVALERPDTVSDKLIHLNVTTNDRYDAPLSNAVGRIEINGVQYDLFNYTYNQVLTPGEVARPSLLQVYLDPAATNKDCAAFGDTWEILVLSQAVQANGAADYETALNKAFGAVNVINATKWFGGVAKVDGADSNIKFDAAPADAVLVDGTDKAAVLNAINSAQPGDVVALTENTVIAGFPAGDKLIIDKAITLDLNGKTLTTECGWGGIDLKGGASIVNGTINHTGNTAAIKAFQVGKIENVVINVTETAGKIKGGIVVQEGAGCYVGSIKNVTITGATNGIETYRCGERTDLAIGSMENVTINAIDTGISLSAPVGEVKNCTIKGAKIGVNAYLKGAYSVTADFINCVIEGADADIYAHDEAGLTNPGSMKVTYNAAMALGLNVVQEIEAEAANRVFVGAK